MKPVMTLGRLCLALLFLPLLPAAPSSGEPEEASGSAEKADPDLGALVRQRYGAKQFAACGASPLPVLNEVCSLGVECNTDPKVGDFVELFNPSEGSVDLSCFVIVSRYGVPFFASGTLPPGQVRAWGEKELGFRIAKWDDEVSLLQLRSAAADQPPFRVVDKLTITHKVSLSIRVPDGGAWKHHDSDDIELHDDEKIPAPGDWLSTFNEKNESAPN